MATIAFMPEVRAFFRGAFAAVSGLLGSLACLALGQHTHTDDLPVYLILLLQVEDEIRFAAAWRSRHSCYVQARAA